LLSRESLKLYLVLPDDSKQTMNYNILKPGTAFTAYRFLEDG
jgi:hypothetical protein